MGFHNHYNDDSFRRGQTSINQQIRHAVEELRQKGDHVLIAAKEALKNGAEIIANDIKSRVPVRTGRLKESIKSESRQDGAIYEFSANARNPKDNFLYGPVVEFSEWHKRKGKRIKKKKKQAFMYPAFDAHAGEVNKMIENAINEAIIRGH